MKQRVKIVMGSAKSAALDLIRYVRLGLHKEIARNADDALVQPAPGRRRQFRACRSRDVYADDGEITIVEFPNVGTPVATDALRAVGMGIRADTFCEHG